MKLFISKRVLIISSVAAVVVVGLTVFAFVFFLSQANQTAASSPTPTPAATSTPAKATTRACALGVIQSIGSSSIVVAENKGAKTVTVMVDSTTIIHKHGADITLSNLAVGDQVRVTSQGVCSKKTLSFTAQTITVTVKVGTPTPTPALSPTP